MSEQSDFEVRIKRLLQESTSTAISFVFSQLTVGITACKLARQCRSDLGLDNTFALRRAEMALHTADRFMWNFKLQHREFDQMTALAERLRFELDALKHR